MSHVGLNVPGTTDIHDLSKGVACRKPIKMNTTRRYMPKVAKDTRRHMTWRIGQCTNREQRQEQRGKLARNWY